MSSLSTAVESALVESIRPRLHQKLKPLFDQSNRCLPILQSTCQQIMNVMGPNSNANSLAQIISRDHGLTCKVLQVANSIAYSPQQTIASVPHAVSWLGLDTVRSLVAAAHLVEQLNHWPERQQLLRRLIAKSLIAATVAGELGAAMEYAQPGQLFTATLLYSIGDLAIAYQAPEIQQAVQAVHAKSKLGVDRTLEETRIIGIPRMALTQALGRIWNLPEELIELFGLTSGPPVGRWQSGQQTYQGVVIGSIRLIEAMTSTGSRQAIDEAKRALLVGSGLPPSRFADLMLAAIDRGRQLVRSMGLPMDLAEVETPSLSEENGKHTLPAKAPVEPTRERKSQRPVPATAPAPIQSRPLETLQTFQDSLREAKDFNSLLGSFVQSLHKDAGFDRVGLALLNLNDSDQLVGRLVLGATPMAPYLRALSGSLSNEHQLFLNVLKRFDPLLMADCTNQTDGAIKQEFVEIWNPVSAILAPLRVGTRPMGLIYCDHGVRNQPVLASDYQTFLLFFMHTTMGINRLAGVL
jgi:HD-like signal output (HDOD) protein